MCGIAGFTGRGFEADGGRARAERMIHALEHRGPDGYGYHFDEGVALAHARLSIIDLATGDQPIVGMRFARVRISRTAIPCASRQWCVASRSSARG